MEKGGDCWAKSAFRQSKKSKALTITPRVCALFVCGAAGKSILKKMNTIENGLLILLWTCLLCAISPAAFGAPEPITPGAIWPDDHGNHIQAHGAGILKQGDTYYLFGEDRSPGLDPRKRYVSCYSSTDLSHWSFRNRVLALGDPENLGVRVLERPKVFYNKATNNM